jgi:hypothetical protein
MTALTSMEFSHWLIAVGSLLLLFGLVGLALRHRSVRAEPELITGDDKYSDPESELTPAEVYYRTAKEKRRARWAEVPHEELADPDPKTQPPAQTFGT